MTASPDPAPAEPARRIRKRRTPAAVARRTIAVLPTLFTLGNLLSGFFAVFLASRPADLVLPFGWTPLTWAAMLIFFGMLLDGLDGRIARLTRSSSDLGAQLDSMADMVSFGVAPAFLVVQVLEVQTPFLGATEAFDTSFDRLGLAVAAAFVACAGLRLARFNVEANAPDDAETEEPDKNWFSGLPSPGAAGAVAGLVLLHQHLLASPKLSGSAVAPAAGLGLDAAALGLLAATLLCALGMVSRLPYVHVLNRYVRGRAPFSTVALAVVAFLLLTVFPQYAIAAGFVGYAVSGPLVRLRSLRS
ncbi:CDP-alcohol phosphatidyltransferase family protein [Phycisphaera mikurensis]|uniref:Putative CDP-diacylglycerol--serine O-phosphatidyltransferase n=1 Tax=Phycisphaera mikurensis (strain NBRC 102666 / KCTC 22515 / FYK2301M01) TaxID=1142394 RepID=I0IAX4_PHYMF|nr:CDP-alcohol phosphatidyltransferase family protein [Phycisphaera mikurensis]MBB6442614.1 CDP-diacylglycerol--serine O-phosphatidyltransferase [Phycisphaera mikurensis]BAM02412.1 putative CDP-diacylglycerol--serine O-phosphatidyltransferase [Phycisphaera mikurensis NBRC 102666]